jgi:hypothetical protein
MSKKLGKFMKRSGKATNYLFILLGVLLLGLIVVLMFSNRLEPFSNGDKKYSIEYYYMDGCPFCVKFDPVWEEVSNIPAMKDKFDFKKYESKSSRSTQFKVNGFPTIMAIKKADDSIYKKYEGNDENYRTKQDFKKFLESLK